MDINMTSPKRKLKVRIMAFMLIFALLNAALVVRTGWIQIVDGARLKKDATKQQTRDRTINSKRGTIYDCNGVELAVSGSVGMITVSPAEIKAAKSAEIVSKKLSEILSMSYEDVYAKITRNTAYEIVKRKVESEQTDQVIALKTDNATKKQFSGVSIEEDTKRYYKDIAAHLIGFTGDENQGLYGIEKAYDEELSGVSGRIIAAKNNVGGEMPFKFEQKFDSKDGLSIVLTIDETIQYFTEKHLEAAVTENGLRKGAAAIVINPNTGEILAMATQPDFDLNKPFELVNPDAKKAIEGLTGEERSKQRQILLDAMWRNKAVSDTYEPGSVFKIMTSAMGLEEGVVKVTDEFNCTGSVRVGGSTIHCWKTQGHGHETFNQGFQNSCNPVFMAVGERVGAAKFQQYFRNFGFGTKTGFDVIGEEAGIFHKASAFNETELATSAFGQSFQVTPLQMVSAVSAIVNGGKLMKPHVVKAFLDQNGNTVKVVENELIRNVISEQTSATMRQMLEEVVSIGTGKNAYVKGFSIGGKTGTSEKTPRGTDARIASFLGVAPANAPELLCLVLLDEPTGALRQGGQIAAPVVRKILEDSLRYKGFEPQLSEEERNMQGTVPEVRDLGIADAKKQVTAAGYKVKIIGSGDTIQEQLPKPGVSLLKESTVILYTQGAEAAKVIVPDLVGKDASTVKKELDSLGLNLEIVGSTQNDMQNAPSTKQDPPAGAEVAPATTVRVEFIHREVD